MHQAVFVSCVLSNERLKPTVRWILLFVLCIWLGSNGQVAQAIEISASRDPGDFIEYWASARLLVNGANPYSPEEMLSLQRAITPDRIHPLLTWNPPWTLFFTRHLANEFPFSSLPMVDAPHDGSNNLLAFVMENLWRGSEPIPNRLADMFRNHPDLHGPEFKSDNSPGAFGHRRIFEFLSPQTFFLSGMSLTLVAIKPHLAYCSG